MDNGQDKSIIKYDRLRRRITIFFIAVFACAVMAVIICLSYWNIENIVVTGNKRFTAEEITEASGLYINENIAMLYMKHPGMLLYLDLEDIEKKVCRISPYIGNVSARLDAKTIYLDIEERTPSLYIQIADSYVLTDRTGYILEILNNCDDCYILFDGLNIDGYVLGNRLDESDIPILNIMNKVSDAIKTADADRKYDTTFASVIEKVNVSEDEKITVFTNRNIIISFGNINDIENKVFSATKIIFTQLNENDKGLLDFEIGPNPVFKSDY